MNHAVLTNSGTLKTLKILDLIANFNSPLTVADISKELHLSTTSVSRICSLLEAEEYLQFRLDGRGYLPGIKFSKLADELIRNNSIWRNERREILAKLSLLIGETCNVSIADGTEMMYFDRVETHWPLRIQFNENDRVPMYCTSGGKLFLSSLTEAQRNRRISKMSLVALTPNTITKGEMLKRELNKIKKQGFSIDNQEFIYGMICVAVPLRNMDGKFFGALATHAPTQRLTLKDAKAHVPALKVAANKLMKSIVE